MSSAIKLRVSPEARADLQDIRDYISQFDEAAADRTVEAIAEAYLSLIDYPLSGRERKDILPNLRNLVVGKYLIFYRLDDGFLIVSRIIHGARDLTAIFGDSVN